MGKTNVEPDSLKKGMVKKNLGLGTVKEKKLGTASLGVKEAKEKKGAFAEGGGVTKDKKSRCPIQKMKSNNYKAGSRRGKHSRAEKWKRPKESRG